ncbi:hypothetical protein [Corynebacterium alimapuense]|uniref:hypothetical protein n=1 Tax=Corynebacterium alimapuense TaxID=1576874 RepID=UPI001FE73713|nr:hypothetical protein [Corynebacterium alimapuense]
MKAYHPDNYMLTVTKVDFITDKYVRIEFAADDLLANHPAHPTQWVRLWIDDGNAKQRQRGYTLLDQNPDEDSFSIEFALHYGPASQ